MHEPVGGCQENDTDSSDRDVVEMEAEGMTFRFYILRERAATLFGVARSREKQVKSAINKYLQTMIRHFKLVKAAYKYCETIAEGPLWTMCGGGAQLQQFYGDDNGYLCTLYLDMEDEDENDAPYAKKRVKDTGFNLVVNGSKNDPKFKNFHVDGINLVYHKQVFGDKY